MYRRLIVLLVVLGAVLTLGTYRLATAQSQDDVLTISQGADTDTLDPLITAVTVSGNVQNQIFDSLLEHDANGKLVPSLATSWKRATPTRWEFKLRKGVTFSNGDPFTSADVKFTIEKIQEPAFKSLKVDSVNTIVKVETPDPYTVIYVTKRPTALMPGRPFYVRIVDAKYWREHGDAYMNEHPIGTGPYELKEWKKDDHVTLVARKGYWGGDVPIKTVIFRPIPEAAARVAALQTGETDIITNVPPQNADQIANGAKTKLGMARSIRVLYVGFNTKKPGIQDNVAFRQALNYAVNVPAIIKTVLGGHAYPLRNGPLTPGLFGYDAKLPSYYYDPEKAKELLKEAGITGPIDIVLHTPSGRYNMDKEVAEAIAGQLQVVGVNATVQSHEWTSYVGQVNRIELVPLYELGWGNDTYDADNTLTALFTSDFRGSTWGTPETDREIDSARYELDEKKRAADYAKILETIHTQAPWLFLFQYQDLYGITKRVAFTPRSDENIFCRDIAWAH